LRCKYHRRRPRRQGDRETSGLAPAFTFNVDPIKEGAIRIFGVSLLAVAALAAAGLLWKRRREELLAQVSPPREKDLEELRQAGF
jgi:uncharacterized protein HemX